MEPRRGDFSGVFPLPDEGGHAAGVEGPKPTENGAIEEWRNAEATIVDYNGGMVRPENGASYRYDGGRRLVIKDEQVMDTCEGPWGQAVVDAAFDDPSIDRLDRTKTLKVLERGAGLNIAGTRIIDRLIGRGSGEYHVVELNDDVADLAEAWKADMEANIRDKERRQGIRYNIKIFIHRGDARVVARQLAEKGEKFNIIISDTYPLDDSETGVNDIEDIDVLKSMLYRDNGVFAFFSYFPGMEAEGDGHMAAKQLGIVRPHFENINFSDVGVKPPEEYRYLFNGGKPVRSLPVVICSKKR